MSDILYKEPDDSLTQLMKEALHIPFGLIAKILDPIMTESTQIRGLNNIINEDGVLKDGPFLWLVKHEHWYDGLEFPAWLLELGVPDLKMPTKRKFVQHKNLSRFINWLMSPICAGVYRTWLGEGVDSPEELKEMQAANWEMMTQLKKDYGKGRHVVMFPEGTTETDGRFPEIRSGAYNLAKVESDDGTVDLIQCVPVGLTYDFMAGDVNLLGFKRDLIFLNVGEPFLYEPVERKPIETDLEWIKRDIDHFEQRILDYFIDLNTYTTSQLAGEYILRKAKAGGTAMCLAELDAVVKRRVEALSTVEGIVIDDDLLVDETRTTRVEKYYRELQDMDYLGKMWSLDLSRILAEPDEVNFRWGNILMYSANRLLHIMEHRPEIAEIIENTR